MKTWFLVRVAGDSGELVRRCESATVDFSEVEPGDTAAIEDAACKLMLLDRAALISGDSLRRVRENVEVERAIERVGDVLDSPAVTQAIASEASVDASIVQAALEAVIEGGTVSLAGPRDRPTAPSLNPYLRRLRRKMIDCTSEAKVFRRKAAKFRTIWRLFEGEELVSKEDIQDSLLAILDSPKARGQFYSSYGGRYGPYLLDRVKAQTTGQLEDCYKINDHVRADFPVMLRLMDAENNGSTT